MKWAVFFVGGAVFAECRGPLPVCQFGRYTRVAFIAKVATVEHNGSTLRILEALRGVPANAKTTRVIGAAREIGKHYLIVSNLWNPRNGALNNPDAMEDCSFGMFPVERVPEEIQFIRDSLRGDVRPSIRGRVLQRAMIPASGIKVTIEPPSGARSTTTSERGEYRFDNLPAGKFPIHFDTPGYTPLPPFRGQIVAPQDGCVINETEMETHGQMRVRVLDTAGRPAAGMVVEAMAQAFLTSRLELQSAGWKTTDAGGYAVITHLPSANFGITVRDSKRILTYRGGPSIERATRIFLDANGSRLDLEVRLPATPSYR